MHSPSVSSSHRSTFIRSTVLVSFLAILLVMSWQVVAAPGAVSLGFTSLPSAQGWSYFNGTSGIPDTSIYSVSGGELHLNSIGQGFSGFAYRYNNVVDSSLPFTLYVRARVVNYEMQSFQNPYGFTMAVSSSVGGYEMGISPGRILGGAADTTISTSVDVSQYHDYRIEGLPNGTFSFYVDNVLLGTLSARAPGSVTNAIAFGDSTAGANAQVDISSLEFSQTGCFINAPQSVFEGAAFTASVQCNNISSVYGFQIGTSSTGGASTSATSYIPGSFVTDVGSDFLEASNAPSNYSVSRRAPATAGSGNFGLGSIDYVANAGLTANSSATLSLDTLLLGDISGASINAPVSSTTVVTVLDLLTLNLTLSSDGTVQQVRDVSASVGAVTRGPQTGSGSSLVLNFADVIESHSATLSADIKSHLQCSGPLNLTTSVTNMSIQLKAGDVVLNGADASARINLFDAVTIGLAFGTAGDGEEDVNGDGTVNIFDLIHVGRNYGAITSVCS